MGPQGRGICNYFHVRPGDVDILMGTFTKSFGASGGYVAGKKTHIDQLRTRVHGAAYSEAISPSVLTQIIASMGSIMGVSDGLPSSSSTSSTLVASPSLPGIPTADTPGYEHLGPAPVSLLPSWMNLPPELRDGSEGQQRLRRLAFNAKYLSIGLMKLGFLVYGHVDSPIIPLLLFNPAKMPMFSRLMLERKTPIAVVVVGYPATTLISSRVRFCLSASHTKADVDELLRACDEVGTVLDLKHGAEQRWTVEEVIEQAVELVHGGQ
jgi:serine palmitoyltransferase